MPVFEVVIILRPTKKDADDGEQETLLLGPKALIAKDEQAAAIGAVMSGKLGTDIDLSRVDVKVRPF